MRLLLENFKKFLKEEPENINPEEPSKLGDVEVEGKIIPVFIDPVNGIGQVPLNHNVNYMGFVVYMTPDEFLKLNPSRDTESGIFKRLKDHMLAQEELRIGPPFLDVRWEDNKWIVVSHEGRGRMLDLRDLMPNKRIPVQVFGRRKVSRAADITDDMLFADFLSDKEAPLPFSFSAQEAILNGQKKNK